MTVSASPRPRLIRGTRAAAALFAPVLAGLANERLCAAFLDPGLALIALSCGPAVAHDRVEVPVRALMADALAADAHAMLVAHNHPAGSPEPSRADRHATRRLAEIARALDIRLVDHLLFAGARVVSFRDLGLL